MRKQLVVVSASVTSMSTTVARSGTYDLLETKSDTGRITSLFATVAGSVVSSTKRTSVAGSAQARVPVAPPCQNVPSEHPAPAAAAKCEAEASRYPKLRGMAPDHERSGLRTQDLGVVRDEELKEELGHIRRAGVHPAPRRKLSHASTGCSSPNVQPRARPALRGAALAPLGCAVCLRDQIFPNPRPYDPFRVPGINCDPRSRGMAFP